MGDKNNDTHTRNEREGEEPRKTKVEKNEIRRWGAGKKENNREKESEHRQANPTGLEEEGRRRTVCSQTRREEAAAYRRRFGHGVNSIWKKEEKINDKYGIEEGRN